MAEPIIAMASILMPALVDATLTEEHTFLVSESASGKMEMRFFAPVVMPFCTSAEKPPMKLMPSASAARCRVCAILRYPSGDAAPPTSEMGVTETRLLTIGIPYIFSMSLPVFTRCSARVVILS